MNWLYKMINGNNLSGPNLMISYNNAKLAQSSMNMESLTTLTDLLIGASSYANDNANDSVRVNTPYSDNEAGSYSDRINEPYSDRVVSPYDPLPLATSYLYDSYGDPLLNTPPTTVDSETSGELTLILLGF